MKISDSVNKNRVPIAFKGAVFIDLASLGEEKSIPIIKDFKRQLGQGLIKKNYKIGDKSYKQDVFVGYNDVDNCESKERLFEIIVATGDDTKLGKKLFAKLAMIDSHINKIINKILEKHNVLNNPAVCVLKSNASNSSGRIRKLNDKDFQVVITPKFLNQINDSCLDRTGEFYMDENIPDKKLKYSYYKNNRGTYEFLNMDFVH